MPAFTERKNDDKHVRLKMLADMRGMSVNKLIDEAASLMLAEFDAETRFKVRAARGNKPRAVELLRKVREAE